MFLYFHDNEVHIDNHGLIIVFKSMHNFTFRFERDSKAIIDKNMDDDNEYLIAMYKKHGWGTCNIPRINHEEYVHEIVIDRCGAGLKIRSIGEKSDFMLYFNSKTFIDGKLICDKKYDYYIPLPYV